MRIATRLLLALGLAVTVIMGVYAAIALHQRAELISEALIRETDTLAQALQAVTDNALRDGRYMDLDRVLGGVGEDPENYLVAVLGPEGDVISGDEVGEIPACLGPALTASEASGGGRGWAECDGRVRWVAVPVQEPAQALVVARRGTVVERDEAASRIRIALTTLALGGGAAVVILLVLRATLSQPLQVILEGVRRLGGADPPKPIVLSRSSGELRELADAFNEMAVRLSAKQAALKREVEERVALEGRVKTEEKFAALGRLTGGLAHELGTPLNVISVRAERILDLPDASPGARRQAREIMGEVDRVADLIRSLTHLARRDRLEPRSLDLRELLKEVQAEVQATARARGVELNLVLPEALSIVGDENLLRLALANLVVNAIQAMDGSEDPGQVVVSLNRGRETEEAIILIQDNGAGVAAEDLSHLFEPFFTTKDVGEGMGLGLAISRGMVEEHGGRLALSPREPRGVEVEVVLPLAPPAALQGEGEP